MIKKLAWDTFKNTGDINTFMEFKKFSELQENLPLNSEHQNNIGIKNPINDTNAGNIYGDN